SANAKFFHRTPNDHPVDAHRFRADRCVRQARALGPATSSRRGEPGKSKRSCGGGNNHFSVEMRQSASKETGVLGFRADATRTQEKDRGRFRSTRTDKSRAALSHSPMGHEKHDP